MDLIKINDRIRANKFLIETTSQLEKYFLNIGVNFDIQMPVQDYKQLFF